MWRANIEQIFRPTETISFKGLDKFQWPHFVIDFNLTFPSKKNFRCNGAINIVANKKKTLTNTECYETLFARSFAQINTNGWYIVIIIIIIVFSAISSEMQPLLDLRLAQQTIRRIF